MKNAKSTVASVAALVAITLSSACGGSDGGGPPVVAVASVVITSPAAPPSFQTLGRTVQFAAQPKDAAGASVTSTVTWSSSNQAAATVNASGLVTAVANGTTSITASAGSQTSPAVVVTVAQVAATISGVPATVTFGAIGSTRQITAALADSGGAAVGATLVGFLRAGAGASATVSLTGLVTATGVGIGDTVVATAGAIVVRAPIVVTQVVKTVTVTSTSATPDTAFTSTRTRQFSATARDSNNNLMAAAVFAWTSSLGGVAAVGAATGLVTAGTTDGSTNITATAGGIGGVRPFVTRRYPATFTISPPSATISAAGGFQLFTGTSLDSVAAAIPITWVSRSTGVVSVSPATGTGTTATATGNGSTFVVMTSQARSDSAAVAVSNQPSAPVTISVSIGDNFFKSVRNNTQGPAFDTVAVGGTVTWTWTGLGTHSVESTSPVGFTSSAIKASGTHVVTFNSAGSFLYDCAVHGGAMSGTIVVR